MFRVLKKLRRDEKGATLIEYGLIVAVIAISLIGLWRQIGFDLRPFYNWIGGTIQEEHAEAFGDGGDNEGEE